MKNQIKVQISTQVKEWYGCEDHVGELGHGRYKNKGGQEFLLTVDEDLFLYDKEKVQKAFNAEYNKSDGFFRYEFLEMVYYSDMVEISQEDLGL